MFVYDLCILFVGWHDVYIVVTCPVLCNVTLWMKILILMLILFFVSCEVVIIAVLQCCNCSKLYIHVFILCQ